MAYENLSGTTKKSFKFGPNGVALSSEAVKSGEKNARRYLISNQKNDVANQPLREPTSSNDDSQSSETGFANFELTIEHIFDNILIKEDMILWLS